MRRSGRSANGSTNDKVVEIIANGPCELYVEIIGESSMQRVEARESDGRLAAPSCRARRWLSPTKASTPSIRSSRPLWRRGSAFRASCRRRRRMAAPSRFRKQVIKEMSLDDYRKMGSFNRVKVSTGEELSDLDRELCEFLDAGKIEDFIRAAVRHRYTMLLSGGTSSERRRFERDSKRGSA